MCVTAYSRGNVVESENKPCKIPSHYKAGEG